MTPKLNIFESVFRDFLTGHRSTFRDQIWWKSVVAKLPKGRIVYQTKKTRAPPPRDSTQPPFCSKWADRAQTSLDVIILDKCPCTYTEFGLDRLRFAGLFPKRLIFSPQKVNTIKGFQPTTIILTRCANNFAKVQAEVIRDSNPKFWIYPGADTGLRRIAANV